MTTATTATTAALMTPAMGAISIGLTVVSLSSWIGGMVMRGQRPSGVDVVRKDHGERVIR